MADVKEFLNPKSMLTPGIAGGVTMMISNTLWFQFELPQKWTALTISFLLGLMVVVAKAPAWQRLVFWVLNYRTWGRCQIDQLGLSPAQAPQAAPDGR